MIASADAVKVQNHQQVPLLYPVKSMCPSRSFDELLGHIDLQFLAKVSPDSELQPVSPPSTFSFPVCLLQPSPAALPEKYSALHQTSLSDQKQALTALLAQATALVEKIKTPVQDADAAGLDVAALCTQLEEMIEQIEDTREELVA